MCRALLVRKALHFCQSDAHFHPYPAAIGASKLCRCCISHYTVDDGIMSRSLRSMHMQCAPNLCQSPCNWS